MSAMVSIVIPTKDRSDLLAQTLASVRAQTYERWEAVVVDDGSTDQSLQLLAAMARQDARIRSINRTGARTGAPACRNQGVAASKGDLVIFLDSDDLLAPHCLEQRVRAMEQDPALDFVVSPCQLFREQPGDVKLLWNGPSPSSDLDRLLNLNVPWQTTGPTWRRGALDRVGPWDEQFMSWQDWEFSIRALVRGLRYQTLRRPDCFWRMPGGTRPSIGSRALMPDHLPSHERLLAKIADMVRDAGLMTEDRARGLGGVYFFVARQWVRHGRFKAARQCWAGARRMQLVNQSVYLSTRLALSVPSRKVQRLLLLVMRAGWYPWRPQFLEDCRGLMWKAPLDATADGEATMAAGVAAGAGAQAGGEPG